MAEERKKSGGGWILRSGFDSSNSVHHTTQDSVSNSTFTRHSVSRAVIITYDIAVEMSGWDLSMTVWKYGKVRMRKEQLLYGRTQNCRKAAPSSSFVLLSETPGEL